MSNTRSLRSCLISPKKPNVEMVQKKFYDAIIKDATIDNITIDEKTLLLLKNSLCKDTRLYIIAQLCNTNNYTHLPIIELNRVLCFYGQFFKDEKNKQEHDDVFSMYTMFLSLLKNNNLYVDYHTLEVYIDVYIDNIESDSNIQYSHVLNYGIHNKPICFNVILINNKLYDFFKNNYGG